MGWLMPAIEVMPPLPRLDSTALLRRCIALGCAGPVSVLVLGSPAALAQQQGYGQTLGTSPMERQVFDAGPGGKSQSILDSTNPIDLMNKLRRSTALDEATSPNSAIDQALKEYEAKATSAPVPSGPLRPAP